MREAAQGCALFDGCIVVIRVNFNNVAIGVHLVAVVVTAVGRSAGLADVPAGVFVGCTGGFPAVAAGCALDAAIPVQ